MEHDDVFKIVEGKNIYWYHLKNRIKTHLGCTGDNAKTHIEALKVCYCVIVYLENIMRKIHKDIHKMVPFILNIYVGKALKGNRGETWA